MDEAEIAFLVTLHGKVQGIGLRKRIAAAARSHGVRGWVRNRLNSDSVTGKTSDGCGEFAATLKTPAQSPAA